MVFAMSVDYLLIYPMIDHSGKVVDKVASYYRVLEVVLLDSYSQVVGLLLLRLFSTYYAKISRWQHPWAHY